MVLVKFIATTNDLASILATFDNLASSSPQLYIDREDAKLSRSGTVSLLTLYVFPQDTVYIVDIHNLGAHAFSTSAAVPSTAPLAASAHKDSPNTVTKTQAEKPLFTLKSLLESPTIPKVFFDVRNDSDALLLIIPSGYKTFTTSNSWN
jgi:exonuclease 3'-5' domain-containing protein 1